MQQQQLAALQQAQLQKQLMAQQLLAGAANPSSATSQETAARKAREVYIGNIAIGVISKVRHAASSSCDEHYLILHGFSLLFLPS